MIFISWYDYVILTKQSTYNLCYAEDVFLLFIQMGDWWERHDLGML